MPGGRYAGYHGGKWKGVILFGLIVGAKRFGELQRFLCKISQRTLSNPWRQLEADGLIRRKVYPQEPPKVEFSVTEKGRSLSDILQDLYAWGMAPVIEKPGGV